MVSGTWGGCCQPGWPTQPGELPRRRAGLYPGTPAPRAHAACMDRAAISPCSDCHRQSRTVRKRKYYLPVADGEMKQLLEPLIRPKCKAWAMFSIYPLFFSLSLGKVDDFRFLAPPQLTQHKARTALYLQWSMDLQIIHPQRYYTITYRCLCWK